ncbi:MAG: 16S rRNA (cytidine(1402)-2'-O)-methyltransferase [Methylophilaceae bacterium]|jgi:16S rRNA (cytidine1402-2'-O)-methyltransferase
MSSKLFIIATPIGNLGDITLRAIETLKNTEYILCEDTRHTRKLLNHFGIKINKILSIHQHNEKEKSEILLKKIIADKADIAYMTDAGTPCVSDPGSFLVNVARNLGIEVFSIPGPSSVVAAYAISGIADGKFNFYGFLPNKKKNTEELLVKIKQEQHPAILFESPNRVLALLEAICEVLDPSTPIFVAREMTKIYETHYSDSAENLCNFFKSNTKSLKGEFVIIINPLKLDDKEEFTHQEIEMLSMLSEELPLKKAADIVAKIFKRNKKDLYKVGLKNKNDK